MKMKKSENFGFVIHDVSRLLRWAFDRQSQELGLTRAQWSVLAHLHRRDGIQQKDLALLMDIKPITLARHLDRLEANTWVERRNDPNDRRAKLIFLMPKAKPMIKKLSNLGQEVSKLALRGIGANEEKAFMVTLLRVRDNLTNSE